MLSQIRASWVRWLQSTLPLLLGLALFVALLAINLPRQLGLSFRFGFSSVVAPLYVVLCACMLISLRAPRWGQAAALCLALGAFALPLSGLWMSGAGDHTIIAGLMPWSDANSYYEGARALLEGTALGGIAARRPMFATYLSTWLGLSNLNLQMALAAMTAVSALACWQAAHEVQRSHGAAAGALVFVFLFLFYRRFSGSTMSENLGLPLGALGFALLWRAAETLDDFLAASPPFDFRHIASHGVGHPANGNWWQWLSLPRAAWGVPAGALLFSLALNARAGAFLILPLLVLWAGWHGQIKTFNLRLAAWSIAAIGLGFIINSIYLRLVVDSATLAFSNFSYTLYGLAAGGKGWQQVLSDYPALRLLPDDEFNRQVYALAFEMIRNHPFGLVQGALTAWGDFFSLQNIGAYGFIDADNELVAALVRGLLFGLGTLGLVFAARQRSARHRLALIATLGILASLPFAPPYDAEEMRAYAATMPYFALLPALGIVALLRLPVLRRLRMLYAGALQLSKAQDTGRPHALNLLSAALPLFMALGLLSLYLLGTPSTLPTITCPSGESAIYVNLARGSYLRIVQDSAGDQTALPQIEWARYKKSIHDSVNSKLVADFIKFTPPALVMNAYDLKKHQQLWLYSDERLLPNPLPERAALCGTWGTDETDRWMLQTFYATRLQAIEK